MKSQNKTTIMCGILFLLTLLLILPNAVLADKNYTVGPVFIDAQLFDDGSMDIVNSRTYNFDGSFHYAYLEFQSHENSHHENFSVSENGQNYVQNDSKDPGTFLVKQTKKSVEVRWFFDADDESRSFDIGYQVTGVMARHPDGALLDHTFIGDRFRKVTHDVTLTIRPPQSISLPDEVLHWLHGPLYAESEENYAGTIVATCSRLPKRTHLTIRAIYPIACFSAAPVSDNLIVESVKAEEARYADEANQMRVDAVLNKAARVKHHALGLKFVAPAMTVIFLLCYVWLFRKYGTRPELPPAPSVVATPPAETPPALVGYMLNSRATTGTDLVGTLMDLARRGYLSLVESEEEKKSVFGKTKTKTVFSWRLDREYLDNNCATLRSFEASLIEFIFDDIGEGRDEVDLDKFKKNSSRFQSFIGSWKKEIGTEAKAADMYNQASIKGALPVALWGVFMMIDGLALIYYFGPAMLIPGLLGLFCALLALAVPHLNKEAAVEASKWKLFKKYLNKRQYAGADSNVVLKDINRFMVYSTILGVKKGSFTAMMDMVPESNFGAIVPWYVCMYGSHGSTSAGSFGAALSTAIVSTTTTMSSAAGLGGGATAGGAGATGGGGGGAG